MNYQFTLNDIPVILIDQIFGTQHSFLKSLKQDNNVHKTATKCKHDTGLFRAENTFNRIVLLLRSKTN